MVVRPGKAAAPDEMEPLVLSPVKDVDLITKLCPHTGKILVCDQIFVQHSQQIKSLCVNCVGIKLAYR